MNRYRAYGLEIESERPLALRPSSAAAAGEADLRVVALDRSEPLPPSGRDRRDLAAGASGWTLRYDNRDGDWIAYDYRPEDRRLLVSASLPWDICAGPLTGVVCGVLLGLNGRTLLHGACLQLGEACFALLGASGHGKSTLAAALIRQGAALLTEDLLVADRTSSGWTVEAGAPSLHLLEDSYAALGPGLSGRAGGGLQPRDGKFALDLAGQPASEQAALAGIYILDPPTPGGAAQLTRLSGRRALLSTLDHLYGAGWIRPAGQADLDFCAGLVSEVQVHRLSRPWRLDAIGETAALVRRHALGEAP